MIDYAIRPADPHAHLFEVSMRIDHPDPAGQRVALAAWIPGSYMIREFARHVVAIGARAGGRAVRLEKLDKHTWRARAVAGPLELRYTVYAWDLSVRAAHLDATHAFFNGTSVFLRAVGQEDVPCRVEITAPEGRAYRDWRVATTLPALRVDARGFGRYRAEDHDALIDHPVEIGTWRSVRFDAGGADHEVVLTGGQDADLARLATDLAPVCAEHARLFEPDSGRAPFDRYLFLTMVVGEGYGGLEHRASTALLASRASLPWRGMGDAAGDDYRRFLGLASHEYFHAWWVKRVKPAAFARYDLEREQHTRLLWVFEGFTSYYDDLMLVRGGAIDVQAYLKAVADTLGGVLRAPGRQLQSIAESSFDAWTKYYRQDENSPNAIVSYYAKGALVALAMDLSLRARSRGTRCLDDVLRLAWRRWGRDFERDRQGMPEGAMPGLVLEATGIDLSREIAQWAEGMADPPLAELLAPFGVELTQAPPAAPASLGVRTSAKGGELAIATAYSGGAAQRAGLSAGDVVVAIDGLRASEAMLKARLARARPRDVIEIVAFRRDELMHFEVRLGVPDPGAPRLGLAPRPSAAARRLLAGWLRTPTAQPRPDRKPAAPGLVGPASCP